MARRLFNSVISLGGYRVRSLDCSTKGDKMSDNNDFKQMTVHYREERIAHIEAFIRVYLEETGKSIDDIELVEEIHTDRPVITWSFKPKKRR